MVKVEERVAALEENRNNMVWRLERIEKKVDEIPEKIDALAQNINWNFVKNDALESIKKEIEDLKSYREWIMRLVVGALVLALISWVIVTWKTSLQ